MVKQLLSKIKSIKLTKQFWIGLVLGIPLTFLITFVISCIVYGPPWKSSISTPTTKPASSPDPSSTPLPIILKSSEIKWLDKPVSISKLPVFKTQEEIDPLFIDIYGGSPDISKYYFLKVADLMDDSILIKAYNSETGFFGDTHQIFFIKNDDKITAIDTEGYRQDYENLSKILLPSVQILVGEIGDLKPPESFISDLGFNFSFPEHTSTLVDLDKLVNKQKFDNSKFGQIYVIYLENSDSPGFYGRSFYLRLDDNSGVNYLLDSKIPSYDNGVQKITWNDDSVNDVTYIIGGAWRGCGADSGTNVLRNLNLSYKGMIVGKTDNGDAIYQVSNPDTLYLINLYNLYKGGYDGNGLEVENIDTFEKFISGKNYFAWEDKLGNVQVYINSKYGQLAECGKPVIYLYPEKEQIVNVQVGARITVSDPIYPAGGWSVLAKPNGELAYQNKVYEYLFWEGLGLGIYPGVKDRGFVVKREDIEDTLKDHLFRLGLNEKESHDFMEFWLPKIPNKPFIKLTWLNTQEMDNLAPLTVSPKPDTKIRIFLDFEGLDTEVKLTPQNLFAPKRRGFTLVEWGGLLVK